MKENEIALLGDVQQKLREMTGDFKGLSPYASPVAMCRRLLDE
jgi:hypothetical protein